MRFTGLFIYWIGCFITLSYLFTLTDWHQFYDLQSLLCTLLPTLCAFFIRPSEHANIAAARCLFVCWISAGLTTTYGLIRTFSHYPIDIDGVLASVSISLLPVFYAFIFALLLAPWILTKTLSQGQA